MNAEYVSGSSPEVLACCSEKTVKKSHIVIALSSILNVISYIVVAAVWASLLFTILYATNVISVLQNFDGSFRYIRDVTPLTSPMTVATIISCYILSLPVVQGIMRNHKPITFKRVVVIHNALLMMASAALAAGIAYIVGQDIYEHGFFYSICSAGTC